MPILVILALTGFCSALSVRILDPLVPAIARDLASDPKTVALLATAFSLPYAVSQPILGPLGDALGKSRVIQVCLVVLFAALIACAVAPNLETLFVARIVTGLASGGIIPLAFAIIGDRFEMSERQVALSRVLAAILLGGIAGGLLAGVIGSILGWRAVLWLVSAATLATVLATLSALRPRRGAPRSAFTVAGARAGYARVFANPRAAVCYTAVFIEGIVVFGVMPFLALILEERGAGSIREAGLVIGAFGLGGIIFAITVRHIIELAGGQLNMIRMGGLVCAAAMTLVALTASWPVMALAYVIVGIGFYMIHNSMQVQATELAPDARGAAVALHAFFFFLGHAAGPVVFGISKGAVGAVAAIILGATVMAVLGFATAAGLRRRSTPPSGGS